MYAGISLNQTALILNGNQRLLVAVTSWVKLFKHVQHRSRCIAYVQDFRLSVTDTWGLNRNTPTVIPNIQSIHRSICL